MRPPVLIAGVAIVAALIGGFLFWTRGAHMELRGEILKVRTHGLSDGSSVAVVDFRFVNPADYQFVVRTVSMTFQGADGKTYEGMMVADADAARMMQAIPELGQKYNETLKTRDKFAPKSQEDRMVAARFETGHDVLSSRKTLKIQVEEVDGVVSEISER
jgi:hypothetical protein